MASSTESLQCLLKDKLSQVKNLLNDANERLQEEASKYEIFATKTSATASSTATTASKKQINPSTIAQQDVPMDLRRTINDITTIQSVLSCPVFNQIVNVTDSLSKLSFHLNLRPSIGPTDINFDSNGELILKPPIEPTAFNNILNGKLDEFSDDFNQSLLNLNQDIINGNGIDPNKFNDLPNQMRLQPTLSSQFDVSNSESRSNGYLQHNESNQMQANSIGQSSENPSYGDAQNKEAQCSPNSASPPMCYGSEKLMKNGTKHLVNGNKIDCTDASAAAPAPSAYDSSIHVDEEGRRLYKANGHFALNQMVPNNMNMKKDSKTTRSMSQINEQFDEAHPFGYSNDLYKTTHELNRTENTAIDQQFRSQSNGQGDNNFLYNIQGYPNNESLAYNNNNNANLVKLQTRQGTKQNRVSPSTSAGSTVRLADECDSGTSSFRSQAAKSAMYSPQPQSLKPKDQSVEEMVDNIDQELIEKLCPEMERIKVTLEKDDNGLGITIAGYTCDEVDLSGIFIKSITPGSPADLSGKIRLLDQIFAVNGQEILGYSNPEAVSVLRRHTGRVVTLELMRYLAESKCRKLQSLLDHATPSSSLQNSTVQQVAKGLVGQTNVLINQQKPLVQLASQFHGSVEADRGVMDASECIYKNTSVFNKAIPNLGRGSSNSNYSNGSQSDASGGQHMPVAAQRGGTTNKIIETKQGARNTIDIRSPLCQATATATYVNKIADIDFCDSAKRSIAARLQQEASDEFGQLVRSDEPEWDRDVQIVELCKDSAQGLGFTVKEYANPKDQSQSIIMITSLTPGGIAERDGRLSFGDLLIFVDDTSLEGASLEETVKALKKTSGQVRLGVLKLKRV